jgi:hypothetical protein
MTNIVSATTHPQVLARPLQLELLYL